MTREEVRCTRTSAAHLLAYCSFTTAGPQRALEQLQAKPNGHIRNGQMFLAAMVWLYPAPDLAAASAELETAPATGIISAINSTTTNTITIQRRVATSVTSLVSIE